MYDPSDLTDLERAIEAQLSRLDDLWRRKERAEARLIDFVKLMWPVVEPARPYVDGWVVEAICEHLEAVTSGEIKRLMMNVPPGTLKSLATNVFWPAWEWGPLDLPSNRYVTFSYADILTRRDNIRFRNVIESQLYQRLWGDRFQPSASQWNIIKAENDKTGWKFASSVTGTGTGERGDRIIIDDPNNVKEAESQAVRNSTNTWALEVMPSRLNDLSTGSIVLIQQRTHEDDVSGTFITKGLGYEHLMIPMEYDARRHCVTSIGWEDPRGLDETSERVSGSDLDEREGVLAFPERFPPNAVRGLKDALGPYAYSAQYQQAPVPRGGGIIKREWWLPYPTPEMQEAIEARLDGVGAIGGGWKTKFPPFSFVIAGLDTALGEKETNDYNALTVWGIWSTPTSRHLAPASRLSTAAVEVDEMGGVRLAEDQRSKAMLIYSWQRRLPLHGPPDEVPPGVTQRDWDGPRYLPDRQKHWGLVEWTVWICRRYRADALVIEDKTRGRDVAQELRRLYADEDWGVHLANPVGDKVSRANAMQHLWSNGVIYAPLVMQDGAWGYPQWAETAIDQFTVFPMGKNDDIVDSGLHALKYLRDRGLLLRRNEQDERASEEMKPKRPRSALYDV